ncbi:MAG: hypothetical protein JJE48_10330 [Actinobacteria bacterium]|nr:hypothetical protein [Actinomycetota bacterium]
MAGGNKEASNEPEETKVRDAREGLISKIEEHWIEIAAAALLALATMMSAWCAFSSGEWHGESIASYHKSSNSMVKSSELFDRAQQQVLIDVISFTNYYNAVSAGDLQLAQAYETRGFSPELESAFNAWKAKDPFVNPDAPATPFAMTEYKNPYRVKAMAEQRYSSEQAARGKDAMHTSNTYILLTVLFASVLFFAGISTKFKEVRIRLALLAFGACVFIAAAVVVLLQPW